MKHGEARHATRNETRRADLGEARAARDAARAALLASGRLDVPVELPVHAHVDELLAAMGSHQVVIVAGETGSGKSTQLPKLCLQLGWGVDGLIGHTQPRRVAARTIAERVAEETGTALGEQVGFAVRFQDRAGPRTLVKVMTDGLLLAEIHRDRQLRAYQALIIDEAHERSLNVDFLLGYVTRLLRRRPDLHLIITSATIDTERFAAHFAANGLDAAVVHVGGRAYPVEVRYRPLDERGDDERGAEDQVGAIVDAVDELVAHGPGDILVFLSGEREIHDAADALRAATRDHGRRAGLHRAEILPLYARLSAAEQHRVFQPGTARRIVLATNVAETSITVPGVRFAIDTGTARISRYSQRLKVQRLPIEPVAQASANQRAGRCGRLGPGVCIRLYGEGDFAARPAYTEPEILRTNLASVVLQMAALDLGAVADFPFLDPPDRAAVRSAERVLEELGAVVIGEHGAPRLTKLGRRLARLPVDPRLARVIVEADREDCVHDALVIAAALSIPDVRERPAEHRQRADELHARFATEGSDLLAVLRLWEYLRSEQRQRSGNQFRKLCAAEFLNPLRVREWQDLFSQLRQAAGDIGIRQRTEHAHPDHLHRAVLAGFLSHLGMRDEPAPRQPGRRPPPVEYRGAHGKRFVVAPGSALGKTTPRWVLAGQLVETDRLRARMVAPVVPEWAERVGGHLCKYSYDDPRWEPGRGTAVVTERVSLLGLPIVTGRARQLEPLDRDLAHRLFVEHALVRGEADEAWLGRLAFRAANAALLDELSARGHRLRTMIELGDEELLAFYLQRVPAEIASTRAFDRWWRDQRDQRGDDVLTIRADDLDLDIAGATPAADLPDELRIGTLTLAVTYRFAPGEPDDGATVHVPVDVLAQLPGAPLTWGAPGMLGELIEHTVRRLPKEMRRTLSPLGEAVARLAERLRGHPADEPFATVLARTLNDDEQLRCTAADVSAALVDAPAHLFARLSIEDGERVIAAGRDLERLRTEVAGHSRLAVAAAARAAGVDERRGLTAWPEEALPESVPIERDGRTVVAYPTLVDDGDSVSVRVVTNPELAARSRRVATRRLLLLRATPSAADVERRLIKAERLHLVASGASLAELIADIAGALANATIDDVGVPADRAEFEELRRATVRRVNADLMPLAHQVIALLTRATALRRRLDQLIAAPLADAVADVRGHLRRLFHAGFVTSVGLVRFADLDRYLRAIEHRVERLRADPGRDRRTLTTVHALEARYAALLARHRRGLPPIELIELGWQLEELRVALFAQSVGAAKGTSVARIERALAGLETDR